jgi:hypothetical protein
MRFLPSSLVDSIKQLKDNVSRGTCINPWYKPSLPPIIKPIPILKMPIKAPMKLVTLKAGRLTLGWRR